MGYTANFTQTFVLPKNFSAELSGLYNSVSYNGTIKAIGYGTLNAGIKKELQNNKGSFQASVTDFLGTCALIVITVPSPERRLISKVM